MDIFWGLTGYLPLLILGLIAYGVSRLIRTARASAAIRQEAKSASTEFAAADGADRRRRSIAAQSILADEAASTDSPPTGDGAVRGPARTDAPTVVSEKSSVVLRRQIPPRPEEHVRSWLGGLPSMPEATVWPRSVSAERPDKGERPLHFLAQICCADLPPELWGGLGPREGWLLLFIDPNEGCPDGDSGFHILHTAELGTERQPPFDLGPVYDGVYTGPDYHHLLPGEEVPNVWRRWPVDIVTVPNEAREVEGRVLVAPEDFAAILYGGAAVAEERDRPRPSRPFTLGHAKHALFALRRDTERSIPPIEISTAVETELRAPQAIPDLISFCESEAPRLQQALDIQLAEGTEGLTSDQLRMRRGRIKHYEDQARWLREMGNADAIIEHLTATPALEAAWQEGLRNHLDTVIDEIGKHDADTPLSEDDWNELTSTFDHHRFARWKQERSRAGDGRPPITFIEHRRTGMLNYPSAMRELVADMYVDGARRALIPDEVIPAMEPYWRQLVSNRPHRMGGYHDGLQSDAVIGPAKELLLFQIASDDAMNWCWGDVGAYYFWIRPKHLAAGDFSGVRMDLECH